VTKGTRKPLISARNVAETQISYAVIVANEQSNALQLPDVELEGFVSAKTVVIEEEEDVKPVLHPIFSRSVSSSSSEAKPAVKTNSKTKQAKSRKEDVVEVADPGLELEYDEEDEDFVLLDNIDKQPTNEAISGGIDVR
jgi:hypothetical protein